jgi:methionyl-tRNA formyltransferase
MRIAVFARVPDVVVWLDQQLRQLGHECVGVVTTEGPRGRYGDEPLSALIDARPLHLDVLVASGPDRFAQLLAVLEPDLAISGGFPLRIPEDALAVPRHGIVNGHPALLPRYRGPNPIGWALRNGDEELGFTFHRMDADFDTGRILARAPRLRRTALAGRPRHVRRRDVTVASRARARGGWRPRRPPDIGRRGLRGILRARVCRDRLDASRGGRA